MKCTIFRLHSNFYNKKDQKVPKIFFEHLATTVSSQSKIKLLISLFTCFCYHSTTNYSIQFEHGYGYTISYICSTVLSIASFSKVDNGLLPHSGFLPRHTLYMQLSSFVIKTTNSFVLIDS